MSRLTEDSPISGPSASTCTSQEGLESSASSASDRTLRVTLLSSEWRSTKGGLSTINRELAIQLAKHSNVEVSMYLPQCTEEDKRVAASHNVQLIKAKELIAFEPIDWLLSVPEDHHMDCVIGHGLPLGRQVQLIQRQYPCKWIQIVHTAPEDLGMFKGYADAISRGEKKHLAEIQLCELADQVVAVGPKLADEYSGYLRHCQKDHAVFKLTPSIFSEFSHMKQATQGKAKFCVLVFGRGDNEDFELKGYDIAAKAIAKLRENSYQLIFVGAPPGKEGGVAEKLCQHGIARTQLRVRSFKESREELVRLFCEVDLVIMPSRTEGFGLTALEALSAGLPVLVSGNSGLGDALKKVLNGSNCVVDSEDPKEWAKAIKTVREKDRDVRLGETIELRGKYAEKYSWEEQCNRLVEKMMDITFSSSERQAVETMGKRPSSLTAIPSPKKSKLGTDVREDVSSGLQSSTQIQKGEMRQEQSKKNAAQQLLDDDGGNNSDGEKKDEEEEVDDSNSDSAGEEITEAGEQLPQQLLEIQLDEQQQMVEEEGNKIRIYEGAVASEGTHWDLTLGAVHLTFPPGAVTEPTSIVVHKWKSSVCSPHLQEHEAVVSNVIEISTSTNEALEFSNGVKLVLSHSAPDLQGYELVIKRLISKETNEWEEVDGTVSARQLSDIEDENPSPKDIPDFSFPVVQADIAECSIYTVICRLIPSPVYTISSRGGCFDHPDYPGVSVTVPKKAVSSKARFPLQLKVQEVPNDEFEGRKVYAGPILRISCPEGIEFLKPVAIQLPVALRVKERRIPDPSICRVTVLFLKSAGENKEWIEITDDLETPARFDGTSVTFQVKRFSGYTCHISWNNKGHDGDRGIFRFLTDILWTQPRLAYFFAYFRPSERIHSRDILDLICCPAHLRDRVKHELEKEGIRSHDASSRKMMMPGRDKAFVSVSGGISPVNKKDMDNICLVLDADFESKDTVLIRLINDQEHCLVEFRSTREPAEGSTLAKLPLALPTLNVNRQSQVVTGGDKDDTHSGLRVSKEVSLSLDALEWLSLRIGDSWEPLARRLGFIDAEITGFHKDKDNYAEKARSMLFRWKEKSAAATYEVLCNALRHEYVGRTDLAKELRRLKLKRHLVT